MSSQVAIRTTGSHLLIQVLKHAHTLGGTVQMEMVEAGMQVQIVEHACRSVALAELPGTAFTLYCARAPRLCILETEFIGKVMRCVRAEDEVAMDVVENGAVIQITVNNSESFRVQCRVPDSDENVEVFRAPVIDDAVECKLPLEEFRQSIRALALFSDTARFEVPGLHRGLTMSSEGPLGSACISFTQDPVHTYTATTLALPLLQETLAPFAQIAAIVHVRFNPHDPVCIEIVHSLTECRVAIYLAPVLDPME